MIRPLLFIILFIFIGVGANAQCGPTTPTFTVDMTGNPNGTWLSPNIVRQDQCCGQNGVVCVKFIITLDSASVGLNFSIASGAIPSGALNYQINCGPAQPLGSPICLTGVGPHVLTFCKPGNNANTYQITSIPAAVGGTDISVNDGCIKTLQATGYNAATVQWNSIYPGATGAYNNFLSCTSNCLNPTVNGGSSPPSYVDYVICGQPNTTCNFSTICDTVRVFFNPSLAVTIAPQNPTICFGATSTTLTAVGSGGSPPYSYLWNNINPSQTIAVGTGTYNVALSDASGCPPVTSQITVTSFSVAIAANAGPDDTVCKQNPITTLNATVDGASGGAWTGGSGTFSPNNTTVTNVQYTPSAAELAAGSATLILTTTGNGTCPADADTVTIYYSDFTAGVSTSVTNVSCTGGTNGSATVNLTGGTGPFSYSWNTVPVQSTATASNLPTGTYSVTITDGIACSYTTTATITQPTALIVSTATTNVSCNGGNNGTLTATPSGGTAPYTYSWQPGAQTTQTATGLIAGTYTLTATDALGCTTSATCTVTQPPVLSVTTSPTNVSCNTGSNGTATSLVAGGTPTYSYSWSPGGGTSQNLSGLGAGTYSLTVTDTKGCTATSTVTVTEPPVLTASTTLTNETCDYLNNGTASVTAGGGTPAYTYLWSANAATTTTVSSLAAGTYTVTVTDSLGCTATAFATITQPATLVTPIINQVNVSCFAGSNGSATANPAGGTPNYTYLWAPGGATSATAGNLIAGTYTVTVTDANSCTAQNTVTITEPAILASTPVITNVSCNGGSNGSVALTASGGTAPYTYLWLPTGQTSATASGLSAGTHTVTITDAQNCQLTVNYTVTEPAALAIAFTTTNVSCFSGSDASATATVSGGTTPYSYSWAPGGATTATASSLSAGTYSLTVTDNLGCILTNTVSITEPILLTASTTLTNETCDYLNNGTATVTAAGGTPGYTYLWTAGAATTTSVSNLSSGTYSVTVTDALGCTTTVTATITEPVTLTTPISGQIDVSCFAGSNGSATANPAGGTPNYTYLWAPGGATSATAGNLIAGTYTVTVTDANSCTAQNTVTITEPAILASTPVITNVSCNGGSNGSVALTASGGTAPYTYLWLPTGQTSATASGLSAGTHTVTITDAQNCQLTVNYTVTEPAALAIAFTTTNVSCFSGSDASATATVSGGTTPYSYSWAPGGATTATASSLSAGTYSLTVTDNLGCILTNTVSITEPTLLTASTTLTNETCDYLNNGTATVTAAGGTPGYTYLWTAGAATTTSVSNLSSGTYSVTVTDALGCTTTVTATITEPVTLTTPISGQIDVSCFAGSNGSATANPAGGTPNYTYLWAPGGATSATAGNLIAGTYTVTVTDANSCTAQNTVTITEPAILASTPVITNVSCNGGSNGSVALTASGGTAPYTYLWLPTGQTSATASGLSAGTHTVTITDAQNCQLTVNYTVTEPAALAIAFTTTNVSCFSGSDASATATVSGGTTPYSYSWAPGGATTATASSLSAGTYSLTVTDNLGCILTNTVSITEPTLLIASTTLTNETCDYLNNGTATVTAAGGTPGYTYLWTAGAATTTSVSNLSSGTYSVTVTDALGCTTTVTATITEPAALAAPIVNVTNVSCFGGSNGTAGTNTSGGTPNYSYLWAPGGSTNATATSLPAGTYTITVTDANTCQVQNTVTVTQPALLAVAMSTTPASCNAGSDGTATAVASGGIAPYTYSWLPGNYTTSAVTGLTAGTYSATATDANGCTMTNSITVTEPSAIVITVTTVNSNCGTPTGQASATVAGGIAPYTYLWSPSGGTSTTANGLLAGPYTIQVTDANGCINTQAANVNENSAPVPTISSQTNVSCFGGSDGSATVSVAGGIGPFTYQWSPSGGTGTTASGLIAGSYTVTVTDQANGCQATASTTPPIQQPPQIFMSVSTQAASCFGSSNGTASVVSVGGTPGYTYLWEGGGTGTTASGYSAGTYTVQLTDANNCTSTSTFTVSQPAAPLAVTTTATPVSCFGGSNGTASSGATGGTTPYNYIWTAGNFASQNIANLPAGTYTVTTTDVNGCTTSNTATVTEPTAISLSTTSTNSNCSAANGQASVTASGGTPGYTYLWSPGGATTSTATGLMTGSYTVFVTDTNSCSDTATVSVIDNPGPVASIASITNVSCNGGSDGTATANVAGGTGPFTFSWAPIGGTNITATGLTPGNYTVTVTAANGCVDTAVTAAITQPFPIVPIVSTTSVSCFGGNNGGAGITASGGTPGYTFNWQGGTTGNSVSGLIAGTYTVQTTDANSCVQTATFTINQPAAPLSVSASSMPALCFGSSDGSASSSASGGTIPYSFNWMAGNFSSQNIFNLAAGIYTVTATDNNGCTATATTTVTQPTAVALTVSSINSDCSAANGQASVTANGGTPGYTYLWSPGGATTSNATGLLAGNYSVLVNDANSCSATATVTVNDNPGPVASIASITNVSCNGGSDGTATASVAGGTGPFTFSWAPIGGTNITATGLTPGNYTVTVTAANGCVDTAVTAAITQPFPIVPIVSTTSVSCFGGNNGGAGITASGGTPGYTFNWQGGTTGNSVSGLIAGTYTVQTTDANSCVQTATFTINQPAAPLSVSASSMPALCFGSSDGSASSSAGGGTIPYSFNWMAGNFSSQNIANLAAGTYTVTATDNNGCTATATTTVTQPTAVALTVSSINSDCSAANGQASVTANGGTPGYTYLWSPGGATTSNATGLLAGNYSVLVNDANSCSATATVTVNDNPGPVASIASITNVSCNGGSDGTATANVAGGTGPFTFSWAPIGGTNITGTGLTPGTYTVTVTSANGCIDTAVTAAITQPFPIVPVVTTTATSCFGGNNGSAAISASGGTPGYTFSWQGGATGSNASGYSAGTYTVQTTDANSCVQTATFTISQPTALTASISATTNVSCFSGNDGNATVTVGGGTPVYTYSWQPTGGNGPTGNGFTAGTYTVNITDLNGCTTSTTAVITQPAQPLTASSSTNAPSCFGGSNGTASINASGGTPVYSYSWAPAGSGQTASGLPQGNYTVTVTDSKSCQTVVSLTISEPSQLTGSLSVVHPSCGFANGSVTSQVSGATPPYSYSWSPGGATGSLITSVGPGIYTVQVTDANNCTISLTDTLVNIPGPSLSVAGVTGTSCFNGSDGTATISITQGTPPFTVTWLPNGSTGTTGTGLAAGTHTASVVDSLGCTASITANVSQPTQVNISVVAVTDVSCNGGSDGTITVSGNGGTPGYTYSWAAPVSSTNDSVTGLAAGTYTVNALDANSCPAVISVIVTEPTPLTATISSVVNPVCFNGTGSASVAASGGTIPYTYLWNSITPQTGSTASGLTDGSYVVSVSDANGCTTSDTAVLVQPTQVITTVGPNDTICVGGTANLTVNATGGAGGYIFAWQTTGAITSNTYSFQPASSATYTVIAYDQNGCAGTPDTAYVAVYNLNPSNIQIIGSNPICPGTGSTIYVVATGNTGPLTYSWSPNIGSGPGAFVVVPQQPTTYSCTVTNSCQLSYVATLQVDFNPQPTIIMSPSDSDFCAPQTIYFQDNSITGNSNDPITSWTWYFGDGDSSSVQNPSHTYSTPGTYSVYLTVSTNGGCTNNNNTSAFVVNAYPYPVANFNINAPYLDLPYDQLICTNLSTGASTYQWDFGDGATSTATNPQHLYSDVTTFQIQLISTTAYGCSDTATKEVTTYADIVFPNAFTPDPDGSNGGSYSYGDLSNNVFYPFTAGVSDYKLQIFNRWGELIFESDEVAKGWDGYYKGQICPQDVYIWKASVKLNNGKRWEKIGDVTLLR